MEIHDLDKQISSGGISRLYFFYGEEQFLIEDKLRRIKEKLIPPDFEELNYTLINDKKITADMIIHELMGVPVMSDKKLIVVKSCGIFSNSKTVDYKKLAEEFKDIPEYICLIFTELEFDRKKEKNLDIFKGCGEVVKFAFLSESRLELWVERMFEREQKIILNREIKTIIAKCGLSMQIISNECKKLMAFLGERTKVTAQDVEAVVSVTAEARVFDMIDNIAENKTSGVMKELMLLRDGGEKPSSVMSLISGRMAELLMVKQLTSDGLDAGRLAEDFEPRRPPFVVKKLISQSKRFGEPYLKRMTLKGIKYTADVRTGTMDKWAAVEMYVAELIKK